MIIERKANMGLAKKLVSLRKEKGLTQMDLAEKLSVSRQAISRWEVGAAAPSTDNLKVLADLYEVSVDYLLNGEPGEVSSHSDGQVTGCHDISTESPVVNEEKDDIPKIRRMLHICVAIIFVLLVIVLALLIIIRTSSNGSNKEEQQIIPIEDMNIVDADDLGYPVYTFPIE